MLKTKKNKSTKKNFSKLQIIYGATREGFSDGIMEVAKKDTRIYAVTADLAGSVGMAKFLEEYPSRFIDVGVAEQNLVTVSSGLAMGGKIPFAASFAAFSPGRNWEQIRTTIAYNNQGVIVVGSHAGLGVGEDGATHQALEDIALMRVIPNMQVVVPCDAIQAKKAVIELTKKPKPTYLRIFRQKTPIITTEETEFILGRVQVFNEGRDVCIISNGPIIYNVISAAEKLKSSKISCSVLNCHTVKPIDEETILKYAKKSELVVVVEDHQINGGLGGAIAELLSKKNPKKILFIAVNDVFGESGSQEELYKKHELDVESIVARIKKELNIKKESKTKINNLIVENKSIRNRKNKLEPKKLLKSIRNKKINVKVDLNNSKNNNLKKVKSKKINFNSKDFKKINSKNSSR